MVIRREPGTAICIGQLSHAWLAGQLARAWGNERFPAPEPREDVLLGAEQHDIGWASVDLEPPYNPATGLPQSFLESSPEEHLGIWRGAPERLLSQSTHAALVVSMHGRSLSELRARNAPEQEPLLREHIEEERERQERLCATLDVSPEQAERTRRQMWAWDGLSLALCLAWRPFALRDVPAADGLVDIELHDDDGSILLDPWPFAHERIHVHCEARRLRERYGSEHEMRRALAGSPPFSLSFELHAA
jgi:Protein of unknown function (DUF3891)